MTATTSSIADAVQRAAAAYPDRDVRGSGWDSGDAFILVTDNPALPPAMRDAEEDKLLVRVAKSTGEVTAGTYVMFRREIASASEV
jgi:hypothetical protein